MREIVIVVKDLYLEPELAAEASAPGIEYLVRFGDLAALAEGWRPWIAHWVGLPQYADAAPASVAAAGIENAPADGMVWLATPVHLIAGLTSVHFDRRSVLQLSQAETEELARSFRDTFHGSEFDLHPLGGGELLLTGPPVASIAVAIEPARLLLMSVADALPIGGGTPALRRLSAEIEMWLHDHPVNAERARRGALTVATLWLWGAGAPAAPRSTAPPRQITDAAFGSDPYIRGLWRLAGGEAQSMPLDWTAVIGDTRAQRALGVMEVAELLHANPSWRLAEAVMEIDRRVISPSVAALLGGRLDRLVLLANDRCLSLRPAHRWRLWRRMRRARRGLEGLA